MNILSDKEKILHLGWPEVEQISAYLNFWVNYCFLSVQVSEMCQQVKEQMFEYYEQHSQGMEASITELSEVLERSSQLSMELQGASQTLAAINKGLQHSTEQ